MNKPKLEEQEGASIFAYKRGIHILITHTVHHIHQCVVFVCSQRLLYYKYATQTHIQTIKGSNEMGTTEKGVRGVRGIDCRGV